MSSFRNITKAHFSLVVTIVLVSMFAGALIQSKQVSAATAATWNPSLGWDFECHTNTHPSFTGFSTNTPPLTDAQIIAQLQAVNAAFQAHDYPPPQHMAYPYGDYDSHVEAVVSQYRKSARTVSDDMTTYPVPDWYALNAAQLIPTTTMTDITNWVTQCINTKSLLIIFTHDISASPSAYGCTPTMLTNLLNYLVQQQNAGKIVVMTIAQAYDTWHNASKQPPPTVVVAFDDANESDYLVAYPLFAARGLKGTSYIVTSYIDEEGQLKWSEIATMRTGTINYAVHLESKQTTSATSNLGTVSFNGLSYTLPANFLKEGGYYQAQYYPAAGYSFDHWETTGAITVASTTTNPTTVTVNSNGTLRAVYKNITIYIFTDGFESGNFNAWSGTIQSAGGSASVTPSAAYQGSYGASFISGGKGGYEHTYCYKSITSSSELFARGYFNITTSGISSNNNRFYFLIFVAGTNPVAYAGWKMIGGIVKWDLLIRNGTQWIDSYSASSPQLNKWYNVELHWSESSTNGYAQLYLNGVLTCSIQGRNTTAFGGVNKVQAGLAELYNCQATKICFDNFIVSNAYIPA